MTADQLTARLAECVLEWRSTPDRFLKEGRRWAPRWRFQPLRQMAHALQLLEKAGAKYSITKAAGGKVTAVAIVNGRSGSALTNSEPMALTLALARALGIDVESVE